MKTIELWVSRAGLDRWIYERKPHKIDDRYIGGYPACALPKLLEDALPELGDGKLKKVKIIVVVVEV